MKRNLSKSLRKIVEDARQEAIANGDKELKPEHIVLAILLDDENLATKTLKKINLDINDLFIKITEQIFISNYKPPISNNFRNKKLPLNVLTKNIFDIIDEICDKFKDGEIGAEHVMLAILKNNNNYFTKLLKNNNVTYQDFYDVIKTTKLPQGAFSDFDSDPSLEPSKGGNNKQKSSSKQLVLDNFSTDITKLAEEGKLDPVIGREGEIKRISQILSRRNKQNPLILGEGGVGKSAIVEGLAQLMKDNKVPRALIGKRILSLDLSSLVAGTKYRGQFEERMKVILEELKTNRDIIVFIDEIHTIVGTGNSSGSLDVSNILKPALARGEIQIIGATTLDEYRENIEKDGALVRRFQQLIIPEPSLDETKLILDRIKLNYEKHHNVTYTEEAINTCVRLADRYITDRFMPDKAIDILDEAGASVNIEVKTPKEITLLEEEKNDIQTKKKEAINKQDFEGAAKYRDEERKVSEKLEIAKNKWLNEINQTKKIVDEDTITEVVSIMTNIPIGKVSTHENKKLLSIEKHFKGKIIGQDVAVESVCRAIKRSRLGIKNKNKPTSLMFLGDSGSGKTLLAKELAKYLFGDEDSLVRIDMSEFMDKINVSRLVGSSPGYIGYEEGGELTEKIRRKPYSVVLLDEIEKAHKDVFNLFLQVLDDGHLTDGLGRKVNFKNCIIIMTSNVGVRELSETSVGFSTGAKASSFNLDKDITIEKALKKVFPPEFLNRLDEKIIFNRLTVEDVKKIVKLELNILKTALKKQGYYLVINDGVVEFITEKGFSPEYGARPINRAIQKYIEDLITDNIIGGDLKVGDKFKIIKDKNNDCLLLKK
jgi:ATP-dependent Clp protease ATP-binding subunit ClpC